MKHKWLSSNYPTSDMLCEDLDSRKRLQGRRSKEREEKDDQLQDRYTCLLLENLKEQIRDRSWHAQDLLDVTPAIDYIGWEFVVVFQPLRCVQLFATPGTITCQAPLVGNNDSQKSGFWSIQIEGCLCKIGHVAKLVSFQSILMKLLLSEPSN